MGTHDTIIDSFIEIDAVDSNLFLKIKETLTRIGIASRKSGLKPTLWQSCHIFHKRGKYYIVHFKQMFLMDGKADKTELTDDDLDRTQVIALLLQKWGLVKIKSELYEIDENVNVVILPYAQKGEWELRAKYSMGKPLNYEHI